MFVLAQNESSHEGLKVTFDTLVVGLSIKKVSRRPGVNVTTAFVYFKGPTGFPKRWLYGCENCRLKKRAFTVIDLFHSVIIYFITGGK